MYHRGGRQAHAGGSRRARHRAYGKLRLLESEGVGPSSWEEAAWLFRAIQPRQTRKVLGQARRDCAGPRKGTRPTSPHRMNLLGRHPATPAIAASSTRCRRSRPPRAARAGTSSTTASNTSSNSAGGEGHGMPRGKAGGGPPATRALAVPPAARAGAAHPRRRPSRGPGRGRRDGGRQRGGSGWSGRSAAGRVGQDKALGRGPRLAVGRAGQTGRAGSGRTGSGRGGAGGAADGAAGRAEAGRPGWSWSARRAGPVGTWDCDRSTSITSAKLGSGWPGSSASTVPPPPVRRGRRVDLLDRGRLLVLVAHHLLDGGAVGEGTAGQEEVEARSPGCTGRRPR